jgi:hypothetical protein
MKQFLKHWCFRLFVGGVVSLGFLSLVQIGLFFFVPGFKAWYLLKLESLQVYYLSFTFDSVWNFLSAHINAMITVGTGFLGIVFLAILGDAFLRRCFFPLFFTQTETEEEELETA